MKRRHATIPPRRRIFLGCEGESEQGYGALLTRIAGQLELHLAPQVILLRPGGGDPLGLVRLAVAKSRQEEAKRGAFFAKAVLLDQDKIGQSPERDQLMYDEATRSGLHLIWQEPSHEALLLRHLPGCQNFRPVTTPLAHQGASPSLAGISQAHVRNTACLTHRNRPGKSGMRVGTDIARLPTPLWLLSERVDRERSLISRTRATRSSFSSLQIRSDGRHPPDSELLIHGMRGFVFRWLSQGWRNRRGSPLHHRDLWAQLIDLDLRLRIHWKWLRGHNGHPLQCRADALAYTAARSLANTQRLAA